MTFHSIVPNEKEICDLLIELDWNSLTISGKEWGAIEIPYSGWPSLRAAIDRLVSEYTKDGYILAEYPPCT